MTIPISEYEFNALMFMSFRYALPRHSYVTGLVSDMLIKHKSKMPISTRERIIKEIKEFLKHTPDVSFFQDQRVWREVLQEMENGK